MAKCIALDQSLLKAIYVMTKMKESFNAELGYRVYPSQFISRIISKESRLDDYRQLNHAVVWEIGQNNIIDEETRDCHF